MTDIAGLVEALRSGDQAKCLAAAEALARLGSDAQPATVALVEACATDDEETLEWVTSALEDLGPPQASDVTPLAALIGDQSLDVAYWAATLLGRLREEAEPAVTALADALDAHPEMAVRQRAAWALGMIGPKAAGAQAALEKAAGSDDRRLASLAREALAKLS